MKIKVTVYDKVRMTEITRRIVEVQKDEWEAMNFLDKEQRCMQAVEDALFIHWRELEKNEV